MKILSPLLTIILLVFTWNLINQPSAVNAAAQQNLLNEIAKIISNTVKEKYPNSSNLVFHELWSEAITKTEIRTKYSYSFDIPIENEELVTETMEGEVNLERVSLDQEPEERWKLKTVKTQNQSFIFNEGFIITPQSEFDSPTEGTPTINSQPELKTNDSENQNQ